LRAGRIDDGLGWESSWDWDMGGMGLLTGRRRRTANSQAVSSN